jgi:predicted lysophospholipase L1 biosynthesis ABC-type transport system permease subunit
LRAAGGTQRRGGGIGRGSIADIVAVSVRRASSKGHPNFGLAVIGLVLIFVGVGAILLWTSYHQSILVVVTGLAIFIGLVLVAAGAGLEWFPMMGVERWRTSHLSSGRRLLSP